MQFVTDILTDLGTAGLHIFWLPVGIWTIASMMLAMLLKRFESKISVAYLYYSRVAILWGLAGGVLGSALFYFLPFFSTQAAGMSTKLLVIQTPITVSSTATADSIHWTNPTLWAGVLTAVVLLLAFAALLKLMVDFISLKSFSAALSRSGPDLTTRLSPINKHLLSKNRYKINIIFSEHIAVPCTFGWSDKRIILPNRLWSDSEKLNMALRHELTHIRNKDFVINTSVKIIRALFFFHPLVHSLSAGIEEYREISCDQQVLQDADISQKKYAKLLFELSPKSIFKTTAAVNMAVRPSTLKKRIQTMTTSTHPIPSLKLSIMLMLISAILMAGLMACSDIEDNGITRSEVQQAQSNIVNTPAGLTPLYVINGEKIRPEKSKNILSRLNVQHIKSINVLKDTMATNVYGQAGKDGVIEIQLKDQKKTLSDLLDEEPQQADSKKVKKAKKLKNVFVAVEDNPEIIGGQKALYDQLTPYPKECKESGIEGRVILQFIINKHGDVEDPEVVRGIGGGCDEAALKAIKKVKFKPGRQRGKAVNLQYSWPVTFKLSSNKDSGKSISNQKGSIQKKKLAVRDLTLSNDGTLTGKVYNKKQNKPLAGTNILIKGTRKGTTTTPDGKFKIRDVDNARGQIQVSYMGYTTQLISYH